MPSPTPGPREEHSQAALRATVIKISAMAPAELALYLAQLDRSDEYNQRLRAAVLRQLRYSSPTYAETYAVLTGMDPLPF